MDNDFNIIEEALHSAEQRGLAYGQMFNPRTGQACSLGELQRAAGYEVDYYTSCMVKSIDQCCDEDPRVKKAVTLLAKHYRERHPQYLNRGDCKCGVCDDDISAIAGISDGMMSAGREAELLESMRYAAKDWYTE